MFGLNEELSVDSPLRDPVASKTPALTDEEHARVSAINRLLSLSQQDRIAAELQWQLCLDYINGEIFLLRNRWTGELTRFRVGENRTAFSKNNIIRPINRALIAKLTRLIPTWSVQRATTDYDELFAARSCEALLQFLHNNLRMDLVFVEMVELMTVLGDAFILPEWSMNVGKPRAFCPMCSFKAPIEQVGQNCPNCEQNELQKQAAKALMGGHDVADPQEKSTIDESTSRPSGGPLEFMQGPIPQVETPVPGSGGPEGAMVAENPPMRPQPIPTLVAGKSGGVVLKVLAPWQGYTEPNVKKIGDMGWTIGAERVPVHEARRRYPWAGEFIHSDAQASDVNAFKFLHSPLPDVSTYVTIYKYIERGTAQFPQGRIVHKVNEFTPQIDMNGVYDVLGYLPICHFTFEKDLKSRSIWGRSWILDGHHHQRELNSLEQLMKEYGERHVRFKLLSPHGSNIREDDITGPNLLVKYSPGIGECKPLQLNEMPQYIAERKGQLISDARGEAGVSDMDAQNTSNPNARAMSIVQAESLQQMKHILVRIYSEWCKLGYIMLAMYQKYGDPDETFTTIGGENPETFSFKDVRLTPGFDIVVEIEDGLSITQPVRLQEATQLAAIGNGILFLDPTTNQFDVGAFAKYAHLKMPNIRPDMQSSEYAAAMQMIHDVLDGTQPPPQPAPEDDAAIFQLVLISWLKGKGRRMLKSGDPTDAAKVNQIRQMYGYYVTQEVQARLNAIAQQSGQAPPPGQSGGPPKPSQPGQGTPSQSGQQPGGNELQQKGAQTGSPVLTQAGNTVHSADQHGEAVAHAGMHEG